MRMVELLDNITSEDITRLVDQIRAATPATAIILFGSQAKGTATKESDIDVCVITRETAKRKLIITREIRKSIASTVLLPVDILVYQENEFAERAILPTTLEFKIEREGIKVYEQ